MSKRADARANRTKLLAAAEVIFNSEGANAPLQHIAVEAGVGRGTLYRHFPDRRALVAALFTNRIEQLIAIGKDTKVTEFAAERVLKATLDIQKSTPGLTQLVISGAPEILDSLQEQTAEIKNYLAAPILAAITAGRIYPDVSASDFLAAWSMFEGVTGTYNGPEYEMRVERARELLLRGILTPAALRTYSTL